jgi:hypothetical protein
MGWKIYSIFITHPGSVSLDEQFLNSLGIVNYKFKEESQFNFAPNQGELFLAKFNGNLIIANPDLNFQFFKKNPTEVQKRILETFSNSEVTVITTGYIYAYAIFKNKIKIRLKEGGDKVYQDFGSELPEELKLQKMQLISQEELEEMKEELSEKEIGEIIKTNISEETVFELTARYLGARIDSSTIKYDEIRGLKFENEQAKKKVSSPEIDDVQFIK